MRKIRPSKVQLKHAHALSDFVISQKKRSSRSYQRTLQHTVVGLIPPTILIISFAFLFLRLFYLQVVRGSYYHALSEDNRILRKTLFAPRGVIYDRNGKVLAHNKAAYKVVDGEKVEWLEEDEALARIAKKDTTVQIDTRRDYPFFNLFSHVVGYVGQISPEEAQSQPFASYYITEYVGKMGLEREYEGILRGDLGQELYEVDALGKIVRSLGRDEPIAGGDIHTTLDVDIQQAVVESFTDVVKGAVIVSDPRDGSILALYSKPSFDPNVFTSPKGYKGKGEYATLSQLLSDTGSQPFLNRAISGTYPPGSTYKLVTAAAALESGKVKIDTLIEDTGVVKVGAFSFANWYYTSYGGKDGFIDVVGAIKRSNDIYFYKIAETTGVEKIYEMSKLFGFGGKLGIDIPSESTGIVPNKEWKKKFIGEDWYLGDNYNLGVGQGYLLATPLQVNSLTEFFANEGVLYKPHLVEEKKEEIRRNFVKKEYITTIREGMKKACEDGGTAYPFFNFGVKNDALPVDTSDVTEMASGGAKLRRISVGCKTGTAEAGVDRKPHAWISVFAPFSRPEIVVTVLVENSGEGSSVAGPIAKRILENYFENKR